MAKPKWSSRQNRFTTNNLFRRYVNRFLAIFAPRDLLYREDVARKGATERMCLCCMPLQIDVALMHGASCT